jgi:hypothetical protein
MTNPPTLSDLMTDLANSTFRAWTAPHGVRNPNGLSGSRGVLVPLGDQPPDGLDDVAAEQRGRHGGVLAEPPGGHDERLHHCVGLDQLPQAARFGKIQCVLPDFILDLLGGLHAVLRLSSFPDRWFGFRGSAIPDV